MDRQLDLGAFLAQRGSEGVVDSEGEFTISHEQARRKLGRFALPRTTAWMSKIVQAAVRWECADLRIRQTLTETLILIQLPDRSPLPTEDTIVASLMSGKVGGETALDAFCLALRALVEQAQLSFLLVIRDDRITPRPIYAGNYYGAISERARLHSRFSPEAGLCLTVRHQQRPRLDDFDDIVATFRGHAPIVAELRKYGSLSPLPILLDGRRVDGVLTSPVMNLSDLDRVVFLLGLDGVENSPPRLRLPEDFEEKLLSLRAHPRRACRSYGGARDFPAAVLISVRIDADIAAVQKGRQSCSLLWLADGVVVGHERLPVGTGGLSLTVLANASGLDTDLTGFTLVDNDEFRLRRQAVLRRAGEELGKERVLSHDAFAVDRDHLSPGDEEFERGQSTLRRRKRLLKLSGPGLALSFLNPAVGLALTVGAFWTSYRYKEKDVAGRLLARESFLAELIAMDLDVLREFLLADELPAPPGRTVEVVFNNSAARRY